MGDRGELGGEGRSGVRGGPPFNGLEGVGKREAPGVAPAAGAPPIALSPRVLADASASGALPATPSCAAPVPRVMCTVEAPV